MVLLYMAVHRNHSFLHFLLAKSEPQILLAPLLALLYAQVCVCVCVRARAYRHSNTHTCKHPHMHAVAHAGTHTCRHV